MEAAMLTEYGSGDKQWGKFAGEIRRFGVPICSSARDKPW
jgi:hypothetical protein